MIINISNIIIFEVKEKNDFIYKNMYHQKYHQIKT